MNHVAEVHQATNAIAEIFDPVAVTAENLLSFVLVIATIALVLVTAQVFRSTKELAKESRLSREHNVAPKVLIKLKEHPEVAAFLYLIVENIGRGPALSVRVSLKTDEADFQAHNVATQAGNKSPVPFLSPGERLEWFFAALHDISRNNGLAPFSATVTYVDTAGQHHEDEITLDVHQFEGPMLHGTSPLWRLMQASEGIRKTLDQIHRNLEKLSSTRTHTTPSRPTEP